MSVSWLPSRQYVLPQSGFWDPVTSTLNWCEEDYYATPYVAEIINTFTNFLFLYFAYLGIQNCRHHGHDRVFLVSYIGYLLVGLGSFCFHATLKYPMQLVDELNMIYTTCLMCYATFSYARSAVFRLSLAFFLTALALGITVYYHYLQDPAFHQRVYAILTTIIVLRQMYVMEFALRPRLKDSEARYKLRHGRSMGLEEKEMSRGEDRRDESILRAMWIMIAIGLFTFLGGFGLWALDIKYCNQLRTWRRKAGLPWGIFLEGHGWWHLMTGTGAYLYIMWAIWLRHCLNGRQDEYEMEWPRLWNLPIVVKRRGPGISVNGDARKTQ